MKKHAGKTHISPLQSTSHLCDDSLQVTTAKEKEKSNNNVNNDDDDDDENALKLKYQRGYASQATCGCVDNISVDL